MNREELEEELKNLTRKKKLTKLECVRIRNLISQLSACICRTCGKQYDESKSRSDWRGFCSVKCQDKKARSLGWRKGEPQYMVLKGQIGSIHVLGKGEKK